MTDILDLAAEKRERAGKGAARAARRAGRIPAVIYGDKRPPVMITVEDRILRRELNKGGFFNTLFDIKVGSKKERVLPRDVQFNPVTDFPEHVDFLRVSAGSKVQLAIPVHFLNEEGSPGLKRGGVLNIVRHELEVECNPENIPSEVAIDLTGRDVGDSIHFSEISLPEGVESVIKDRDFTIATIAAPSALKGAEEEEEAAEEEVAEEEAAEAAEAAEEDAESEKS